MMTDEMLYRAAKQVNTAIVEHWEQHEVEEHSFSLRFERRIRRLTRKANNPQLYRFLNKAACLLLTALISFAAVMSFNVEARAAFTRWIREVYEDSIVYEFFGERSRISCKDYRVTWMPEEYEMKHEYIHDLEIMYGAYYQNRNDVNDTIVIEWFLAEVADKAYIIANENEYRCIEIKINGQVGEYYESITQEETNNLIWIDEKDNIFFAIDSYLEFDKMKKIAESIQKVN